MVCNTSESDPKYHFMYFSTKHSPPLSIGHLDWVMFAPWIIYERIFLLSFDERPVYTWWFHAIRAYLLHYRKISLSFNSLLCQFQWDFLTNSPLIDSRSHPWRQDDDAPKSFLFDSSNSCWFCTMDRWIATTATRFHLAPWLEHVRQVVQREWNISNRIRLFEVINKEIKLTSGSWWNNSVGMRVQYILSRWESTSNVNT